MLGWPRGPGAGPAAVEERGKEMAEVVYRSQVRIERVKGPVRKAYLPAEKDPVIFGVHGAVATHYKIAPDAFEPRATTLDYVVAAAAG
jgi:hypothetical protein